MGTPFVRYTYDKLLEAYELWRSYQFLEDLQFRVAAWDRYCDIRDSLPLGTNTNRRLRKNEQHMH